MLIGLMQPRRPEPPASFRGERSLYIVSPAFNEAQGISEFVAAVYSATSSIADRWRVILIIVDDGSSDGTFQAVLEAASEATSGRFEVVALALSRNFGQQSAIQAGLEYAFARATAADAFVVMDSDLQHPPELLPVVAERILGGEDHVQMVRTDPDALPLLKTATSDVFYALFRRLSDIPIGRGCSDFRAMSHRFVGAYLQLRERGRFNRGLFHWLGFQLGTQPYQCGTRRFGQTKYSLGRMLRFAATGIFQFSSKPLILLCFSIVGLSFLTCAAYLGFEFVRYMRGVEFAVGWPTLLFFVSFWSGAISLSQLMLAVYVGRIFDEIKGRPIYVVKEIASSGMAKTRDAKGAASAGLGRD